jgi:murein L,D-transpeptidase YcbB/YkuD
MRNPKKILFVIALIAVSLNQIQGQDSITFTKFINNSSFTTAELKYSKEVKDFYTYNGFHYTWLAKQGSGNLKLLSNFIEHSSSIGLNRQDYQPGIFKRYFSGLLIASNELDSLLAEVKFTDNAIHFIHDVLVGNQPVSVAYNGLNYTPSCYNIPVILKDYIDNGRFKNLIDELESSDKGYLAIKSKLNFFQQQLLTKNFSEEMVKSSRKIDHGILIKRLYQLGFIPSDTVTLSEPLLIEKIKEAQVSFNLFNDGIAGKITLKVLNVPLMKRVDELKFTLNTIRWLSCIKQNSQIIVVNIPSATLLFYDNQKIVLESRIIVGKPSTPTPTLCSKITEVILYPYWNVPHKIATRELLPLIKQNSSYLEANNYQVLNKNGKVLAPSSINWSSLSSNYFPYLLRQSTGCDNSLGLIKLNFFNPFTVYLHDTPAKNLFDLNERYFSHGCMRLQKAVEVGHYVLKDNSIAIDTLTEKGCLKNQAPITVGAAEEIPVFVLYQTAWFDSEGKVRFYKDIYEKFSSKKNF